LAERNKNATLRMHERLDYQQIPFNLKIRWLKKIGLQFTVSFSIKLQRELAVQT
jgi:hypothetical protein